MPALSLLAERLHEPLPAFSLITDSIVVEALIVTFPVGVVRESCGETVTDRCSTCSCP